MTGVEVPLPRPQRLVDAPSPLDGPHLADSSVWSKTRSHQALAEWFNGEVRAGRIQTCGVVVLELLRSARNAAAYQEQSDLLSVLDQCPQGTPELRRAGAVQGMLARRGRHRGVPPADLLIAAAAEAGGIAVLHYDHDYDLIAEATGQPARWILPAGSLP